MLPVNFFQIPEWKDKKLIIFKKWEEIKNGASETDSKFCKQLPHRERGVVQQQGWRKARKMYGTVWR